MTNYQFGQNSMVSSQFKRRSYRMRTNKLFENHVQTIEELEKTLKKQKAPQWGSDPLGSHQVTLQRRFSTHF